MQKIDQDLHAKFSQYGRSAREWMRKCILLLPEIERRQIWRKKGFGSIYEYAAKLAGMSHETVNEGLRILKKIADKPLLKEIAEQKGINILKPIVNLVEDAAGEKFWAGKAREMSKNTLEAYVRAVKKQDGLPGKAENPQQISVQMDLDPEIFSQLQKLKGSGDWNETMQKLLNIRQEQLEQKKPEPVVAKSRHIPVAIKKFVLQKTASRCAFPGCNRSAKILHHTERYAISHSHDPDKIAPLCVAHERLAHLGLIENEESPAKNWKILRRADRNQLKFIVDSEVAEYRR